MDTWILYALDAGVYIYLFTISYFPVNKVIFNVNTAVFEFLSAAANAI